MYGLLIGALILFFTFGLSVSSFVCSLVALYRSRKK